MCRKLRCRHIGLRDTNLSDSQTCSGSGQGSSTRKDLNSIIARTTSSKTGDRGGT